MRTGRQVLVVAGLATAVTVLLYFTAARHGFFDLRVYQGAVHFWVHDDGEIYDYVKPDSKYGFTYPPFAALLMLPLAYLGWHAAIVLSVAASVVVTAVLLWWLTGSIATRLGWGRWFTLAVALCLAAAFEPVRETVNFGQVNLLLLGLVAADLLWLVRPGSRWAGVGIGLATAVKLTPGVFIVYLLVTGRWRAAFTAMGTAAAATLVAGALAPDASREFWTYALWNTDRVGSLSFISNQSLQGLVARLDPVDPSTVLWLALVAAVVAVWAVRCRRALAADPGWGGEATGLALTGVLGALISPVTWVHHLVWLLPALLLTLDRALALPRDDRWRRRLLILVGVSYLVLCSRLVWVWERNFSGPLGFLGGNAYVWISLALLVPLPAGAPLLTSGGPGGLTVRPIRPVAVRLSPPAGGPTVGDRS